MYQLDISLLKTLLCTLAYSQTCVKVVYKGYGTRLVVYSNSFFASAIYNIYERSSIIEKNSKQFLTVAFY